MARETCDDCGALHYEDHTYEQCIVRLVRQRNEASAQLAEVKARVEAVVKEMRARATSASVNADRAVPYGSHVARWMYVHEAWYEAADMLEKVLKA